MISLHLNAQCFMSASCPFFALTNSGKSSLGPERCFGKLDELEPTKYFLPASGTAVLSSISCRLPRVKCSPICNDFVFLKGDIRLNVILDTAILLLCSLSNRAAMEETQIESIAINRRMINIIRLRSHLCLNRACLS